MSVDGKLGILIVTLAALFLVYLDNAGKLYPAMALIAGPAINDGNPAIDLSAAAASSSSVKVPAGGVAPFPILPGSIEPLPTGGTSTIITGINGGVKVPYAPPLPTGGLRPL